jgi:deazaflavin-dependent oxidoreductase (nitroreductase family)
MDAFNAKISEEFRANDGVVGGDFTGHPLLLLHHRGARSGTERIAPLAFVPDGQRWVVFASKGGAPTHPDWFHNIGANPDTVIEVGSETVPVTVHIAEGAERDRIWEAARITAPQFAHYQTLTERIIPVLVLERRPADQ